MAGYPSQRATIAADSHHPSRSQPPAPSLTIPGRDRQQPAIPRRDDRGMLGVLYGLAVVVGAAISVLI